MAGILTRAQGPLNASSSPRVLYVGRCIRFNGVTVPATNTMLRYNVFYEPEWVVLFIFKRVSAGFAWILSPRRSPDGWYARGCPLGYVCARFHSLNRGLCDESAGFWSSSYCREDTDLRVAIRLAIVQMSRFEGNFCGLDSAGTWFIGWPPSSISRLQRYHLLRLEKRFLMKAFAFDRVVVKGTDSAVWLVILLSEFLEYSFIYSLVILEDFEARLEEGSCDEQFLFS